MFNMVADIKLNMALVLSSFGISSSDWNIFRGISSLGRCMWVSLFSRHIRKKLARLIALMLYSRWVTRLRHSLFARYRNGEIVAEGKCNLQITKVDG